MCGILNTNTIASHGLGAWRAEHTPKALCRYCHRDKEWCSLSPWFAFPPFGVEINLTGAACWGLGVLSRRFIAAQTVAMGAGWDELLLFHQPAYRTEEWRHKFFTTLLTSPALDFIYHLAFVWPLNTEKWEAERQQWEMAWYSEHSFQHGNPVP